MPRPRLVPTLLVLSLVLNVCVLGGLAYSHFFGPQLRARQDAALFRELQFDADQQQAFLAFRRTVGGDGRAMRQKVRALSATIWQDFAADKPDPAQLKSLVTELGSARIDFQNRASTALLTFLAQLTPEQRHQVVDKLHRRSADMRTGFPAN